MPGRQVLASTRGSSGVSSAQLSNNTREPQLSRIGVRNCQAHLRGTLARLEKVSDVPRLSAAPAANVETVAAIAIVRREHPFIRHRRLGARASSSTRAKWR